MAEDIIKVVCAWCGKDIETKPGHGVSGTSHGICEECSKHYFPTEFQKVNGDRPAKKEMRKLHRVISAAFLIYLATWVGWHLLMIWKYGKIIITEGSKLILAFEILGMVLAISLGIIEIIFVFKGKAK